ncbi:PREDICTED: uncharacterized protein LOC105556792 [Vollenhovia emeryi]|uniref:uncharacterized protein LOC105556792 n=1 Tax=Vollenhovia emeryi TaxID=411798 RepID=UPI0005F547CB|nr:PREDICTED: uncharacterized protein LOC105556792 [Vollenhovia emeryi]
MKHIRALKALKRPTDQWDDLIIHLVTSKLDQLTYKDWENTIERGKLPTFEELMRFLNQRCRTIEMTSRQSKTVGSASQEKAAHHRSTTAHVATTKNACGFCHQENHAVYKCKDFLALNVEQRLREAKTHKLCLNCLRVASHLAKECTAGTCSKRHNTLLHFEQSSRSQPESDVGGEESNAQETTKSITLAPAAINQGQQVLLATAMVNVTDVKGATRSIRALLDNGSQSCFITKDCCKELGLKRQDTNIPVCGLGEHSVQTRSMAKIIIQSRTTGYKKRLNCLVVDTITQKLPISRISRSHLQVPDGITLADPQFDQPSRIDLLLGAEIFFDLLCIGRLKLADNQPSWQKTLLGWILDGLWGAHYCRTTPEDYCLQPSHK